MIDPFAELRQLEWSQRMRAAPAQRARRRVRGRRSAASLWRAPRRGGAQALGAADRAPSRRDARRPDRARRRRSRARRAAAGRTCSMRRFSGPAGDPCGDVMAGGRWIVREGRHAREQDVLRRFRAALARTISIARHMSAAAVPGECRQAMDRPDALRPAAHQRAPRDDARARQVMARYPMRRSASAAARSPGSAPRASCRAMSRAARTLDAQRRWATPGLVDCHTHLVYAGNRAGEFERRLEGASYADIARAGGGIQSTVRGDARGRRRSARRRQRAAARGDGDREGGDHGRDQVRLRARHRERAQAAARRARARRGARRRRAYDAARRACAAAGVRRPRRRVHRLRLRATRFPRSRARASPTRSTHSARRSASRRAQTRRVFEAARAHGLPVKLHADQLSDGGRRGAGRGVRRTVRRSSRIHERARASRRWRGPAPWRCCCPARSTRCARRECRRSTRSRAHGVPIAIATDCNPGTSPATSLPLMMNMACTLFGLTPREALAGVTRHAARALGLADRGTLAVGPARGHRTVGHRRARASSRIGSAPTRARPSSVAAASSGARFDVGRMRIRRTRGGLDAAVAALTRGDCAADRERAARGPARARRDRAAHAAAARAMPDTDWHVDELYAFAPSAGATLIAATHSRYVVDLNRDPSGAELYPGRGQHGAVPDADLRERADLRARRGTDAGRNRRAARARTSSRTTRCSRPKSRACASGTAMPC